MAIFLHSNKNIIFSQRQKYWNTKKKKQDLSWVMQKKMYFCSRLESDGAKEEVADAARLPEKPFYFYYKCTQS